MPYRVCKTYQVESGHMLTKSSGRCRFPHGHTRQVEVVLESDSLDDKQMVCDFVVLKRILHECLDDYDHAMCMNTDDPEFDRFEEAYGARIVPFRGQDPTTEVIAKAIFDAVGEKLAEARVRPDVRLKRLRLWETGTSWAEYEVP